jgi:leucine dehydrogenase
VQLAIAAALAGRGQSLAGASVAIQGVGSVGRALALGLHRAGVHVIAADPAREALAHLPLEIERVAPGQILGVTCDVFAPCGPPGVLDEVTARALPARIVCGAANNPLTEPSVARVLEARGIAYVPDFIANAGGLIHLAVALGGGDDAATRRHLKVIPANLERVQAHAKARAIDSARAAEELAQAAITRR